uniref:Uncharacterized protein n=1 Tax=Anguilla anguilla TaxID=7936 RepID=A0A0E9RM66_ANGAN
MMYHFVWRYFYVTSLRNSGWRVLASCCMSCPSFNMLS